jgi:G3E family GTPase
VNEHGIDVFRMKGVLAFAGDECRWVMQGVHMLVNAERDLPWPADGARQSQLVFIGRNLDRAELEAGIAGCIA